MLGKVGHQVTRLKRTRIANIKIGRLSQGDWRHLTAMEKECLLKEL